MIILDTAATYSLAIFSPGEGRAARRTGAMRGLKTSQPTVKPPPRIVYSFLIQRPKKVTKHVELSSRQTAECISLRFHDFLFAGFSAEFQGDS